MRKYYMIFVLMLLVFNYSYSTTKIMPENDWKKKGLKGRVMKMITHSRKYSQSGKDEGIEEVIIIFNSQGYITKEIHKGAYTLSYEYDKNSYLIKSVDVYGIEHEYEYEYDENGYLVQTDRETKSRSFETITKTFYNKQGKIMKIQRYSQNEYDKKGVKSSGLSKYIKDKKKGLLELIGEDTYIYDKKGKLIKIEDTKITNSKNDTVITYEFLKNGLYIKNVEVNGVQKFSTCYDKNGNKLEWAWITYFPEPHIQKFIVFSEMKKDKKGNLTEQIGKYMEVTDDIKGKAKELGLAEEIKIEYEYYE